MEDFVVQTSPNGREILLGIEDFGLGSSQLMYIVHGEFADGDTELVTHQFNHPTIGTSAN